MGLIEIGVLSDLSVAVRSKLLRCSSNPNFVRQLGVRVSLVLQGRTSSQIWETTKNLVQMMTPSGENGIIETGLVWVNIFFLRTIDVETLASRVSCTAPFLQWRNFKAFVSRMDNSYWLLWLSVFCCTCPLAPWATVYPPCGCSPLIKGCPCWIAGIYSSCGKGYFCRETQKQGVVAQFSFPSCGLCTWQLLLWNWIRYGTECTK